MKNSIDNKPFLCVTEVGPAYYHIEVVDDLWHLLEDAGYCRASELSAFERRLKNKWKIE